MLKIGRFSTVVPPRPGVTPPTTFVPASIISWVWNWPMRPDMPWTMTRVSSVMRMAMIRAPYSAATGCGRARTAARAASARVSAEMRGRPELRMISRPSSTLVPDRRTMTGRVSPTSS